MLYKYGKEWNDKRINSETIKTEIEHFQTKQ